MERELAIGQQPFMTVGAKPGFFRGSGKSFVEIWQQRELLSRLVKREIKGRYKDSSLGIVWSLFRPLVQLLIYYFAIGQVLGASRGVPDFAIFVFIGLTTWGLYAEIISGTTVSILGNAGLVKKVYLPREIYPLSAVGSALVNFGIQLVVLIAGILILSPLPWSVNLLLAPAGIITLIVFGTAAGFLLAALNVYLRDVQHFVEIYLLVFFWASPIVYPFASLHNALHGNWMEQVYLANPVTIAVLAMQKALWAAAGTPIKGVLPAWPGHLELRLLIAFLASIVLLWFTQRVFARLQGNFAQEL
jgi:ABC-2 type transport system permease protein